MPKRFFLKILMTDEEDDLLLEVRENESERIRRIVSDTVCSPYDGFKWITAIDGRSYCLNLAYVQAIRFLWEPSEGHPDATTYEGMTLIRMRNRREPVETFPEPVNLYGLFRDLESPNDDFVMFEDEDGEAIGLMPSEVKWVMAPTEQLAQGRREIDEDA